ncbi:Uma2 family endonuclease, partial [Salmonella enterica]|nr:Uma2 family endonuclease [Salmonella enterica]
SETAMRDGASTVADYETFVEGRRDDELFELIRGRIVMMTNPSEDHGQITANLFAPLKAAMDAAGCRVYAGGMRVQRSEDRDGDMAAIPDIVVRCGPRRDRNFVTDPLVVVEVLSPSTMHLDRGAKFEFYRSLPTLRHIVFVYQRQVRVEHFRRIGEGWAPIELVRTTDRLDLDGIDVS